MYLYKYICIHTCIDVRVHTYAIKVSVADYTFSVNECISIIQKICCKLFIFMGFPLCHLFVLYSCEQFSFVMSGKM